MRPLAIMFLAATALIWAVACGMQKTSSVSGSLNHLQVNGQLLNQSDTLYFVKNGDLTKTDCKAISRVQKQYVIFVCCTND